MTDQINEARLQYVTTKERIHNIEQGTKQGNLNVEYKKLSIFRRQWKKLSTGVGNLDENDVE